MNKRVCAALLALLIGVLACTPALADGPPEPAEDGIIEQPLTPAPSDASTPETGDGPVDGTPSEVPSEPEPPEEPSHEAPLESPPAPEQPSNELPPEVTPPSPELEDGGCDTIEELAERLAQAGGGVVAVTGDLDLDVGSNIWLETDTPVTIDLGPYGITVPEGATLGLIGPITLTGGGAPKPLLTVSGFLTTMDGAALRATGENAVAVRLAGGGWNTNRASVGAVGANACAVEAEGIERVDLYRVQLTAEGENALCIRSPAPVRLILCRTESDGALADAPALTLDGTAASPEPEAARVIRRAAVPHDDYETNGLWIEMGASQEELEGLLESRLFSTRFEYGLYDEARQEEDLLHFTAMTWAGDTVDLAVPGVYWLTGTPEDWDLGGVAPPEKRVPVHVADPARPAIREGIQIDGGMGLRFFRPIEGAESMTLWYSADLGRTWHDAGALPEAEIKDDGAYLPALPEPNRDYLFRLEVAGGPMAGRSNTLRCLYYDNLWGWGGGGDWDGGDRGDQGEEPPAGGVVPLPEPEPDSAAPEEPPDLPPQEDGPSAGEQPGGGDRPSQEGRPGLIPEPAIPPLLDSVIIAAEPEEALPPVQSIQPAPPAPSQSPDAAPLDLVHPETPPAGDPERQPAEPPEAPPPAETAPPAAPAAGVSSDGPSGPAPAADAAPDPPPPPAETPQPAAPEGEPAPRVPILPLALCAGALALGGVLLYRRKRGGRAKAVKGLPLLLAAALAVSCLACVLCFRYDNKYTALRPASGQGVTRLNMDWYDANPLFYLVEGWSFYRDKLLTPAELAGQEPDAYFYIGRYGGFDLGDPEADPHGQGTYRTVVELDGRPRQFALELPPVFSCWRLWVNGELMQSVGMGDENAPAPAHGMAVFTAKDQIEIVVTAADDSGYYSGMVYPPALGSPQAVSGVLSARGYLHAVAAALALALALACLAAGRLPRLAKPCRSLSLLCLCLAGATAGPALHGLGLGWTGSPGQRACYYGIFLALLWTVGDVCGLPRRLRRFAAGTGAAVCALVLLQPLFPVERAGTLFALSTALGIYKLLTALYILASGAWALQRGRRGSAALLCGGMIFAGALVMDRLLPVYEPIYGGWFVELAGWAVLALVGGAALWDTAALYRREQLLRTELAVRAEHARLQQDYVHETRERLHESRSRLALISHYLDQGERGKLRSYLDGLLSSRQGSGACQYTGNTLVDAILSLALARAEREGVAVDLDPAPLPHDLPYNDEAITSLLMNLLDNALEANERLPDRGERWLTLRIEPTEGGLRLRCANAAPPQSGDGTSKADKGAHGFGLPLLRKIAAEYGGSVELERLEDRCTVTVTLAHSPQTEEALV